MNGRRTRSGRHPRRIWCRLVPWVAAAAILCTNVSAGAGEGPRPPCDGGPFPPYPALENPPAVMAWDRAGSGRDWIPPACTGWTTPGFTTLVATAARFRNDSGAEGLLRRIGAISGLAGVRYWSTTHARWQALIVDAQALADATGDRPRDDFSPDDMTEGKALYFRQEDNLTGRAIYRMRMRTVSPDRLVFDVENVGTVRYLLMPVFGPGDIQSIAFLDRESPDVWRYYCLMRTGKGASPLAAGYSASTVNRAVGYYRHLAGIPTDAEPPAAQ